MVQQLLVYDPDDHHSEARLSVRQPASNSLSCIVPGSCILAKRRRSGMTDGHTAMSSYNAQRKVQEALSQHVASILSIGFLAEALADPTQHEGRQKC